MAKLLPLKGKYYGTKIELKSGDIIEVWVGHQKKNYKPSPREIENGWTSDIGFDHVETEDDYNIAVAIIKTLDEMGY